MAPRELVFVGALLLGLVLLPVRWSTRVVAIGAAVIALVLAGTFLPTFSMQILNGILLSAVVIVLVIWTLTFLLRLHMSTARLTAESARVNGVASRSVSRISPCRP